MSSESGCNPRTDEIVSIPASKTPLFTAGKVAVNGRRSQTQLVMGLNGYSGIAPSTWEPKPQQNAKALRLFRDGMDDMNDVLRFPPGAGVGQLRNAARKVSVELRKLLYDSTPLVHRVLHRPRFHPLWNRGRLTGDVYENVFRMQIAPGTKEGPLPGLVARRTWRITVHPLHGLKFDNEGRRWIIVPLFDTQAQPMALGSWLRQRLFCVDRREYSLHDALKFLSNKEAVHVDIEKDVQAKDMERVHFGHTTYPHLVAIMVTSYMLGQYKTSLDVQEEKWSAFVGAGSPATEYEVIGGGEFDAVDMSPVGLDGEFHETGIGLPMPGSLWKPVRIEEGTVVHA